MHSVRLCICDFGPWFLNIIRWPWRIHMLLFDLGLDVFIWRTRWHRWCGCSSLRSWDSSVTFWQKNITISQLLRQYLDCLVGTFSIKYKRRTKVSAVEGILCSLASLFRIKIVNEKNIYIYLSVNLILPFSNLFGVLEAPPSSSKSGGAMDGLARGGVCTLLLGGLLAVKSEGLRLLAFALDTWPGRDPSSGSEFGPDYQNVGNKELMHNPALIYE